MKGGVAIYKHDSINNDIISLNLEHFSTPLICEVTAISFVISKKSRLNVLGVYRPPKNDKESFSLALQTLSNVLDEWTSANNTTVIIGDFNVDHLQPSNERTLLNELLATYDIQRLELPPTRITKDTSSSIDMFCISSQRLGEVDFQVAQTGISDHTGQLFNLLPEIRESVPMTATLRHINNDTLQHLKILLAEQDWNEVLQCGNVEEAYDNFITTVTLALNSACPVRRSRAKPRSTVKHVFDEEAGLLKTQYLEAHNIYILSGRNEDREIANELKRSYDLKLRSLRKAANATYISESNNKSKAVWKIINSERQPKREPSNTAHLNIGETVIDDPVDVSNEFNAFFTSIAEETLKKIQTEKTDHIQSHEWQFEYPTSVFTPTSKKELVKIINSMKNKTSSGLDEVSSLMLKRCHEELIEPLNHIINLSFNQGHVPKKMKSSKVVPLHKSGSKYELGNYRPISLVSTFSKLMEKVVLSRIVDHLERNGIVLDKQHGFISNRSTSTALVSLVEDVIDKLEEGQTVMGIFLDLSKAFDCLSHSLILAKLTALGFEERALAWFQSYLNGRDQVVEIKQTKNNICTAVRSSKLAVNRGVPQGSVLGPVLFVLFTADFPAYTSPFCNMVMYADDTVLITSNKNKEKLEVESFIALNMAVEFCNMNDLVFNESKTKQLNFGTLREEVSDFPDIERVEATKHLGVVIDSALTWWEHLDGLCSSLSSVLFALRRVKNISTPEAVMTTYNSLFESRLRYGIVLWGATSQSNLKRVLTIQKKAVRMIAGLGWRDSCREAFKDLKILTVVNIYLLEVICLAVSADPQRNRDVHSHRTRNASNFNLPAHRTARFQRKPTYAGAKLFNVLPDEVKRTNPDKLKKILSDWLLSRPFYNIEEFKNWKNDSV